MLMLDAHVKSVTVNVGKKTVLFSFAAVMDTEALNKATLLAYHVDKGMVTLTVEPRQMELVPSSEGED